MRFLFTTFGGDVAFSYGKHIHATSTGHPLGGLESAHRRLDTSGWPVEGTGWPSAALLHHRALSSSRNRLFILILRTRAKREAVSSVTEERGKVATMQDNATPLAGIRVLDLTRLLPGPFCTQLLADLGADVIKIEDPAGGDYLRHTPPLADDGTSILFHALNRGKRSVTLNLKAESDRTQFLALCQDADVVVESFRPGVMARLGLGLEALHAVNPRLIVCAISGYGQSGPLRHRAGHDINYVARAGAFALMKRPTLLPVQVADLAGGAWPAAMQICAALVGRATSGVGAFIDVDMCATVTGLLSLVLPGHRWAKPSTTAKTS